MIIEDERSVELLTKSVGLFIQLGSGRGVNRVALTEPTDESVNFWGFAAILPRIPVPTISGIHIFSRQRKKDIRLFVRAFRETQIPNNVAAMGIKDDPLVGLLNKGNFAKMYLPYTVLGIGETVASNRRALALWFLEGLSPQTALTDIHSGLDRMISLQN